MKITEDCINHNAIHLINGNAEPWEMYGEDPHVDHQRLIVLGYIRGVLDMAKAMKEVLKA